MHMRHFRRRVNAIPTKEPRGCTESKYELARSCHQGHRSHRPDTRHLRTARSYQGGSTSSAAGTADVPAAAADQHVEPLGEAKRWLQGILNLYQLHLY